MKTRSSILCVLILITTSALFACNQPSLPAFVERFNLPKFTRGNEVCAFNSSGTTEVKRYENTTLEDLVFYKNVLLNEGFYIYDENAIENNRFVTMINDKLSVHLSWFSNTKAMRIIAEEKGEMCPLVDEYQESVTSLLTGYKGQTVVAYEGMGYIIRLADGSFCIIDGGMGDPDHVDSDNIMNILKEQSPEGTEKPIIAAWIFTHLHGDHVGVFNCFSMDHHDDVIIQKLIYNFVREEEIELSDSTYMLDDSIYRWNNFKKNLRDYYSDVPIVKVHTGDRFKIRNAEFEVLFTLEDLYPQTILDGNGMNESSLLLKMTLAEQTYMWTGDFGYIANGIVLNEYSSKTLSCDFLQMAHHGLNGSIELYSAIDPTYSLLPIWNRIESDGVSSIEWVLSFSQNQWLVNSENMKQMIVTACGTWTIELPYAPDPDKILRIPTIDTVYPRYPSLLGK